MAKCTGKLQKSPQLLSKAMEEQFTHLTYQGKRNGSVVLTNNQCTEQLERTQILPTPCLCRTANIT